MNTPDNKNKLLAELDALMQDLSAEEVAGLDEVWSLSASAQGQDPKPEEIGRAWSAIESTIDESETPVPATIHQLPQRTETPVIPLRWMAAAASIIIAAVGLGYFMQPILVTAPMGEMAQVVLHDGSSVELNSGATLSYSRWFGDERHVKLEGEAFFDVVKDETPFVVETFNASVRVLGTSFNVKAWPASVEADTRVALRTGKVALNRLEKNASTQSPLTLLPGQTGIVGKEEFSISTTDTLIVSRALAWRSGNFFYSDELLGSILDDVERRFNTSVELNPASLHNKRMKLALDTPGSAELIINDIAETLGLKYRETSLGYEIFDPK